MTAGQGDSDGVEDGLPEVFAVLNEIGIIEQLARTRLERLLPDGLRMSHFAVLNHFVRRGDPETPAHLAQAFQVSRAAMTNTLARLEARGLVAITGDHHDRRSKRVTLTEAGRTAHARCLRALAPDIARLEAAFGSQPFAEVLPFLTALRRWLDADRDHAPG